MGKDKSAAADKREQVLPAKTEKNAAVETSAAPAKKSRAAGMLRLAAAVLLILAASAAALLYYPKALPTPSTVCMTKSAKWKR